MSSEAGDLAAAVRRASRALAADARRAAPGVTAAMRAVLEALADGPRTVPAIAAGQRASRQHVQQAVDALYAAGLAVPRGNPEHRRSHLVTPTPRGREVVAETRRREAELLAEVAAELGAERMAAATAALNELAGVLERRRDIAAAGARP